jgi:hypothetical protein
MPGNHVGSFITAKKQVRMTSTKKLVKPMAFTRGKNIYYPGTWPSSDIELLGCSFYKSNQWV